MALVVKDRVKQTTTTTGTGSIVLNGNVSGFQTFTAALSNGDTTYYGIFEPSTNEYEVGLGTWTESTATLARTTVLESSNSGSAVNLTAQAEVFITQPAEKAVFQDSNGDVDLGGNKILFGNLYSTTGDLPSASTYHGMFAHVHGTGKAYYAHGGNWIELVNEDTSGNVSMGGNLTVTGDLTVNGTTTTVNTTNTVVTDSLIELANGTTGSPSNDAGIVIERGDSNNAFIGYDESADKFTVGTGSFTGASTGNLTITTGTLVANVEGNVTGNVTGDVTGNADTVDSLHASSFLRSDAADSASGTITVATGTNPAIIAKSDDWGEQLEILRNHASFWPSVKFSNTSGEKGKVFVDTSNNNLMYVKGSTSNYETVWTSLTDGSGSGLDADLLDGVQGSSYLRSDADDTFTGTLTVSGSAVIDDITINGSTISDAGNLTVDVGGDIILDSATGYVKFLDTGTEYGRVYESANRLVIQSMVSDADLLFSGVDGGSGFTALTLDMSDAGSAIFNNHVYISDNSKLIFGASSDLQIYHDTSHSIIQEAGTGALKVKGDDIRLEDASGNNIIKAVGSGSAELYEAGNKKLETTTTGISVTGNIAVSGTVDGIDIAGNINQAVKTTSSPQFANVYIDDKIYHHADADTYISFTTDTVQVYAGNSYAQFSGGMLLLNDGSLAEDYDALSGTTPTINVTSGGAFSLTMSGNTTFTFSGASSGYIQGFVLQLTGNGSTVTYPNTVRWAGGTAPDAPANGETDILVFHTRDGGSNWYGVLASDAAA